MFSSTSSKYNCNTSTNYFNKIKALIWLLFIYYRKVHLNNSRNVLDCLPLLLVMIWIVLTEIDPEKFPLVFTRHAERENNNPDAMEETFESNLSGEELVKHKFSEFISKILIKKTSENFEKSKLEALQDIIKEDLRKISILSDYVSFREDEPLSFQLKIKEEADLRSMIEILKTKYEVKLKVKNFDERIFLIENSTADCSPVKFTPFKRQKLSSEYVETLPKGRQLFQIPEGVHHGDNPYKVTPSFNQGDGNILGNYGHVNIPNSGIGSGTAHFSVPLRQPNSSMVFGDPFKGVDIKELSKV